MLASLLTNEPLAPNSPARGGGGSRSRRCGEKFITQDEWLEIQRKLSEFKAEPKEQQKVIARAAIKKISQVAPNNDIIEDAQEAINETVNILSSLHNIEVVMMAYFAMNERKRCRNNTAALLMLGIL